MSTAPAPRPSGGQLAPAHERLAHQRSAASLRAEHTQSVAMGLLTIHDVIEAAGRPGGRPLLRISINQLLLAQPGWGTARTRTVLDRLRLMTETRSAKEKVARLDIAWLVDPRARGTRLVAFLDVTCQPTGAPWPGFPFRPAPEGAVLQGASR